MTVLIKLIITFVLIVIAALAINELDKDP